MSIRVAQKSKLSDHALLILCVSLISFFSLCGLSSSADDHLIENGDFDSISGWNPGTYHGAGYNANISNVTYVSSPYSLYFPYAYVYLDYWDRACTSDSFIVPVSSNLTVDFYFVFLRSTGVPPYSYNSAYFDVVNSTTGLSVGGANLPYDAYSWTRLNYTYYIPAGEYYLEFSCYSRTDCAFDDIILDLEGYSYVPTGEVYSYNPPFKYTDWETLDPNDYNIIGGYISGYVGTAYLDIYGIDSDSYDLIQTLNFTVESDMEFTFPAPDVYISSGYQALYSVLRTSSNYTIDNCTIPFNPADSGDAFFFYPSTIGYDETSTLYYYYDYDYLYEGFPDKGDWDIRRIAHWYTGMSYGQEVDSPILVSGLGTNGSGEYVLGPYNFTHYSYPGGVKTWVDTDSQVDGYALKHDGHQKLSASLTVSPDKQAPQAPVYNEAKDIDDDDDDSDNGDDTDNNVPVVPGLPDSYDPPDYPIDPDDPDIPYVGPDEGDDDYDDNSSYNDTSGEWEYNNGTNGSGDGYFPSNVPGDTPVNFSILSGYYGYVDNLFVPLNSTVFGVSGFLLSPLTSLTNAVNYENTTFTTYRDAVINQGFLAEFVAPVFNGIPTKLQALITYSLILTILGYILRGSK